MTITTSNTHAEIEALRKDIIVAINEVKGRPEVPINGFHYVEIPKERLMSPFEFRVRRAAQGWIILCVASTIAIGSAIAWDATHADAEPIKAPAQVGSILSDSNPPVWVDPELGE